MRVGIDGNLLCGQRTGMGTVTYNVLINYQPQKDIEITVYIPGKMDDGFYSKMKECGIKVVTYKKCNYILWEQIVLPRFLKEDKVDCVWFPYNTASLFSPCSSIVTIYDVIYMKESFLNPPTLYKKCGLLYRKLIVPFAAKKAKQIITSSKFAKDEIVSFFPKVNNKISIVYNGVDIINVKKAKELSLENDFYKFKVENNIGQDYILGFGSLEERKNSMRLIQGYEKLPIKIQKKYQLILFGFRGWQQSKEYAYLKLKHIQNVKMLGYVSDTEKQLLYLNCKIFVFPSLAEGFGLPILEAFAASVPVITSNTTSLPEVAGEAAVFVNPEDVTDIASKIEMLISSCSLQQELIEKGARQLEKFRWKNTSQSIFKIIKSIENHS
ncbi:MAG: hypothetical protein K0R21_252 [Anaerocolumna sp.]|jgi:glycosyltransferase involved in cell wall biosynthesis|nr:hypothetical protein [Anaerocolumna sp.]